MQNSNMLEVLQDRNIVIPLYFLKRIKDFKLKTEEFIFLMYLYNLGDKILFDPNKFANDLNIDNKKIMDYIGTLTDKHFIRVEVLKNDKGLMEEVVLLEDFYNKISLVSVSNDNSKNSTIFDIVEKEFGRTLSPMEYEIIKAWLDNNIKESLIKEAIKEATFNGVSNLRYIDKILYEWSKKGIKTAKDVENNRKKRAKSKDNKSDVDLELVDWNWFDED